MLRRKVSEAAAWAEYLATCRGSRPVIDEDGRCRTCDFIDGHHPTCPGAWNSDDVEAYAWQRLQEQLA